MTVKACGSHDTELVSVYRFVKVFGGSTGAGKRLTKILAVKSVTLPLP